MSQVFQPGQELDRVPLFPLPQVVHFPGAMLPLHVFEKRYQAMVRDALAGERLISAVHVSDENDRDAHGHPAISRIAGVGRIVDHEALPDGRSNILLEGVARVAVDELPFEKPYREARMTVLEPVSTPTTQADLTALLSSATRFAALLERGDTPAEPFTLPKEEPGRIADLCAHRLVVEGCERQRLLEELDDRRRVQLCTELIAVQTVMLQRNGPSSLS